MAAVEPLEEPDDGGDAACWLNLVCPQCGELGGHRSGCPLAGLGAEVEAGRPAPPPPEAGSPTAGDDRPSEG